MQFAGSRIRVVYLLVLRYLRSNQDAVLRELNLKIRKEVKKAEIYSELGLREWEVPPMLQIRPPLIVLQSLRPRARRAQRHLKELEEEIKHVWRSHLPRPPAATPLETVTRKTPTVTRTKPHGRRGDRT